MRPLPFAMGLGLGLLAALAGCRRAENTVTPSTSATVVGPGMRDASLYDRLGGTAGIRRFVNELTDRASSNPAINFTREGTTREWHATPGNVDHFKDRFVDYLVSLTGGPAVYEGSTMLEVHRHMRITDSEYDAFLDEVISTLHSQSIDPEAGRELVRLFDNLRGDMVEIPRRPVFDTSTR